MADKRWHGVIPERDFEVFEACGYGQRIGFGGRAALLVIDVNVNFLGDTREPILDSVKRFPYSCGEAGWDALPYVAHVIQHARAVGAPIGYSTGRWTAAAADTGVLTAVNARHVELTPPDHAGHAILDEIQPQPSDLFIEKHYPSMFFGTPLMSYLHFLQVDTILVAGCTTSGCVRATVVDAYSYNFRTCVIEECVFDRSETSHTMALVDMDMKYADVISCDEAIRYLDSRSDAAGVSSAPSAAPAGHPS